MQPFGRNIYGPKIGWAVPLWGGGAGSPSNTVWSGPRPTCVPSFILIHPTVWAQCTNVTDKQDRTDRTGQTDNGLIAYGEPFYKRSSKNCGTNRFAVWFVHLDGLTEAQVQSNSPGGVNVPTWEGTLAPPGEYN